MDAKVQRLRSQISSLESVLDDLRKQLAEAEESPAPQGNGTTVSATLSTGSMNGPKRRRGSDTTQSTDGEGSDDSSSISSAKECPMPLDDYKRYGRQMILPQVGLEGHLSLRSGRVLIVGLGGLGCPAAMYLAGAGIGTLGLMDGDTVELSNLHRQILHTTERIGWNKATSAVEGLKAINPKVFYRPYQFHLTSEKALDLIERNYDLILDCTDHPSSRYLISDVAVRAALPVISASALKTEGQLLVYNQPPNRAPVRESNRGFCYRCVFPRPPPPESVQSCGEGGILGPVVGMMGVLMATEAIKMYTVEDPESSASTMLLYSAYSDTPFRTIRLKGRRATCAACKFPSDINRGVLQTGSFDYVSFCGTRNLPMSAFKLKRCPPTLYKARGPTTDRPSRPILLDVRNSTEFGICHLRDAINLPLSEIQQDKGALRDHLLESSCNKHPLFFICRYGNDSLEAVRLAEEFQQDARLSVNVEIMDIKGGLKAWKDEVDPSFPEY